MSFSKMIYFWWATCEYCQKMYDVDVSMLRGSPSVRRTSSGVMPMRILLALGVDPCWDAGEGFEAGEAPFWLPFLYATLALAREDDCCARLAGFCGAIVGTPPDSMALRRLSVSSAFLRRTSIACANSCCLDSAALFAGD